MHLTHLIIDDFFSDPHRIRREALNLEYPAPEAGANYPGRNASTRLIMDGVETVIAQLTHERLAVAPNTSHGRPRLALGGETGGYSVHLDYNHWSAIVYLSLDEHGREGTHFYKHKRTGLDRGPVFPGEAEGLGYANSHEACDAIVRADGRHPDRWERLMTVPMRFNRLVLFRGYCWHDAGVSFGATPQDGRLILPFFFVKTQA